jgi:hypothetical protein
MKAIHVKKGDKYGYLTIVNETSSVRRASGRGVHRRFICQCKCGDMTVVALKDLRIGDTQSCGCHKIERIKETKTTHGLTVGGKPHPVYTVLAGMKARCYNKKENSYSDYGGRGIRICKEWLAPGGYKVFYDWAMSLPLHTRWKQGREIDRMNNNGHYTPENCHFVSSSDNGRNTRDNIWVEIPDQVTDEDIKELQKYGRKYGCRMFKYENGKELMLLIDLWERYGAKGISYGSARTRIQQRNRYGWTPWTAITTSVKSATEAGKASARSRKHTHWVDVTKSMLSNPAFALYVNNSEHDVLQKVGGKQQIRFMDLFEIYAPEGLLYDTAYSRILRHPENWTPLEAVILLRKTK